jgi:hypothetical protein
MSQRLLRPYLNLLLNRNKSLLLNQRLRLLWNKILLNHLLLSHPLNRLLLVLKEEETGLYSLLKKLLLVVGCQLLFKLQA